MERKKEESGQVFFSETMLPEDSPFSVINHRNRSTPPSEPSRSSATAALYRHHHIQFSKQVIPRKITRQRALATLQQWRTPKRSKRIWRQVLFYVRWHKISLQGEMEVAEKDSLRIKRSKSGCKKCRFNLLTRFIITRLFKKRGSSEDFKYDLAKATKTGNFDDIINTIQSRLEIIGLK